jgi:hypothetical protein
MTYDEHNIEQHDDAINIIHNETTHVFERMTFIDTHDCATYLRSFDLYVIRDCDDVRAFASRETYLRDDDNTYCVVYASI